MSLAEDALKFASVFEGELLAQLMLTQWGHPFAGDEEFCSQLVEAAAQVLQASIDGETFIEGLPPDSMNFVSALWYAEWMQTETLQGADEDDLNKRREWLAAVRHVLPSCFCNPDLLD